MKYTHVIWDFNGTILDDVSIGIDAVNVMLSSRNIPLIKSVEEYRKIFGFPIKDYYRRCGFDFEKDDYETVLAPEWVAEYKRREHDARLCDGVMDALMLFQAHNIKQTVISASSYDMLCEQIDRLGIGSFFEEIIGCSNYYAYGKGKICCNYVDRHTLDTFILAGDSTHDHEVASEAGIDSALILSGHMSREALEECSCPLFSNALDFADYVIKQNSTITE